MTPRSGRNKRPLSSLGDVLMDPVPAKRLETTFPVGNGMPQPVQPLAAPTWATTPPAMAPFAVEPASLPSPSPQAAMPPALKRTSSQGIENPIVTLEPTPGSVVLYQPRSTKLDTLLESLSPALKRGQVSHTMSSLHVL